MVPLNNDIALWLGHYERKHQAPLRGGPLGNEGESLVARLDGPKTKIHRYRPAAELLQYLQQL